MENISILCVDDEKNIVNALKIILEKSGYTAFTALNGFDALSILDKEHIDIAIIDYMMPRMSGTELLKKINEKSRNTEVLILTGHGTIPNAVKSIQLGASDYILKPFHKDDLLNRIEKIVRIKELRHENVELKSQLGEKYNFKNLIGRAPQMIEIFETIRKIADGDSPVLILGETGSGKEEIVKAIHYGGIRTQKNLNIIDCASINPNLFESELFGHVKGAFTGAVKDKLGLLKATGDGTILLDEIGDIPIYIQVKLLRAIEERIIKPVGSIQSHRIAARIIAATSRNLSEAIQNGTFREDLFYRLSVVTITIPPLRERKDDIPLLVNHFIAKYSKNKNIDTKISDEVVNTFMDYDWPGNVRELENCIERAFILGAQEVIDVINIPASIMSAKENVSEAGTPTIPLAEQEKEIIAKALISSNGNKRLAAKSLNVGIATLYRKIKKYGLDR